MGCQQQHSEGIWLACANRADQEAGKGAGSRTDAPPILLGIMPEEGRAQRHQQSRCLLRKGPCL